MSAPRSRVSTLPAANPIHNRSSLYAGLLLMPLFMILAAAACSGGGVGGSGVSVERVAVGDTLIVRNTLPETLPPLFTLEEVRCAAGMVEAVYEKAGAEEAFRFSLHEGPHRFDVPMQEEAFDWFDRWLK